MKRKAQRTAMIIVLALLASFVIQVIQPVPVIAGVVEAVTVITSIEFDVTPPTIGGVATLEGIRTNEGIKVNIDRSSWFAEYSDGPLDSGTPFEAGKVYRLKLFVEPLDGYAFDIEGESLTVKVNGEIPAYYDGDFYFWENTKHILVLYVAFPPLPEEGDPPVKIDEVLLSVEAPEAGKRPSDDVEVKDGEGNTDSVGVLPPFWNVYDSEEGKWVSMKDKPFEAGKKYRITIGLAANTLDPNTKKSYAFAASDEMTIKVNGQPATRFYAESAEFTDYRIVEHEFELPPLSDPDGPTPPDTGETETPQEPDKPTPPDSNKPTPPDSGETPEPTPEADKDKKTDKTSDLPATGESRGIALWLGLALLLVGAVLLISRKKMTSK